LFVVKKFIFDTIKVALVVRRRPFENLFFNMGLAFCVCPAVTALPDITDFTCGENFGQIQKLIFQRRQATQPFATVAAAQVRAGWEPFFDATDATKATRTPYVENFTIPGTVAKKEGGGDNSTLNGRAIPVDPDAVVAPGRFRSLPAAIFKILKQYACETDLTVYLINNAGKIIGHSVNGTTYGGIPISNFFISDKEALGFGTDDKNNFEFTLDPWWSTDLKYVTPTDFNALVDDLHGA
jgi:hypothetical protein